MGPRKCFIMPTKCISRHLCWVMGYCGVECLKGAMGQNQSGGAMAKARENTGPWVWEER